MGGRLGDEVVGDFSKRDIERVTAMFDQLGPIYDAMTRFDQQMLDSGNKVADFEMMRLGCQSSAMRMVGTRQVALAAAEAAEKASRSLACRQRQTPLPKKWNA